MNKMLRVLACASILFALSPAAYADNQGGMGGGGMGGPPGGGHGGPREACRQDAQQFCQDVQPGGGRIKDCLEDHYKEISDACYDALKNAPPPPPMGQGGGMNGGQGGGQRGGGPQGWSHQGGGQQQNGGPPPEDGGDDQGGN